jgi:parallel beta-helix repeat protein
MNDSCRKIIIISTIVLLIGSNINLIIETKGNKENNLSSSLSKNTEVITEKIVNSLMITKSNIESNPTYEYVIITSKNFENSNFQLLIGHKSQYINATIVILENILENSSFWVNGTYGDATNTSNGNPWIEDGKEVSVNFSIFNDTAAKIRNFIRYIYQEWGTKYVLLGGDVETIPVRKLYVNLSNWHSSLIGEVPIEGWIPSDLYFGNLDGTWNDDFDNKFGERKNYSINDEADFIAEVYIGRAPVDNKYDVATFVNKIIQFETTQKPNDILLHQSNLLPQGIPDTSVIPEACAQLVPSKYNVHRLYQKNEKVTIDKWINCFSTPSKLVILQVGNGYYHGPDNSWYQLYNDIFGKVKFKNSDVGKLRNTFYPIHISISCLGGNFCYTDCIAEELLLWSRGGASACLFNSEVGCVNKTDASKYSSEFIEKIFYEMFKNDTKNLGKINLFSKYHFINLAQEDPNYRWCYYEKNLLGDPETPVFETREKLPLFSVFVDDGFNEATPDWNITRFDNIQKAVNAVPENGVVNVHSGIYHETIVINKTINLFGEDKYTTIIDGDDSEIIVTIKSNSSSIRNFTIHHNSSTQKIQNQTGVFVPPNCWGNEISNNIIMNNKDCGILIQDSCRTYIHDNIIQLNGEGIRIKNKISGLFEEYIVVTCHNIVYHNKIISNDNYGVYLEATINNEILNNTFMNNSVGYKPSNFKDDAFFKLSKYNTWNGNYWSKPCDRKYIYGTRGPIFLWYPDLSNGLINAIIFPSRIYVAIINIGIPIPEVDENPAQEPHDIW